VAVKKVIAYISICFAVLSCGTKEEVPAELLTQEQMVRLHIDLHIAEAQSKKLNLRGDSAFVVFRYLRNDIFNQQQVSDSLYQASYEWYIQHPKVMEQIYNVVIDSLKARQQLATRPNKKDKKKRPPTSKE